MKYWKINLAVLIVWWGIWIYYSNFLELTFWQSLYVYVVGLFGIDGWFRMTNELGESNYE